MSHLEKAVLFGQDVQLLTRAHQSQALGVLARLAPQGEAGVPGWDQRGRLTRLDPAQSFDALKLGHAPSVWQRAVLPRGRFRRQGSRAGQPEPTRPARAVLMLPADVELTRRDAAGAAEEVAGSGLQRDAVG